MTSEIAGGCTFCQAVALIAYGDDDIAAHYGAAPGEADSGYKARAWHRTYFFGAHPELPGRASINQIDDAEERLAARRSWEDTDDVRWKEAKARLCSAVKDGLLTALRIEDGEPLPSSRWQVRDLEREASGIRFSRLDLDRLLNNTLAESGPTARPRPPSNAAVKAWLHDRDKSEGQASLWKAAKEQIPKVSRERLFELWGEMHPEALLRSRGRPRKQK